LWSSEASLPSSQTINYHIQKNQQSPFASFCTIDWIICCSSKSDSSC
jgi:hypothetical protein